MEEGEGGEEKEKERGKKEKERNEKEKRACKMGRRGARPEERRDWGELGRGERKCHKQWKKGREHGEKGDSERNEKRPRG